MEILIIQIFFCEVPPCSSSGLLSEEVVDLGLDVLLTCLVEGVQEAVHVSHNIRDLIEFCLDIKLRSYILSSLNIILPCRHQTTFCSTWRTF